MLAPDALGLSLSPLSLFWAGFAMFSSVPAAWNRNPRHGAALERCSTAMQEHMVRLGLLHLYLYLLLAGA